jgi:predicted DsbA family dithiol-disulfide isomerase
MLTGGTLAITAWVYGAPRLATWWPSRLTYRELEGLAPFRFLERKGSLSTAGAFLLGLDDKKRPDPSHVARVAAVHAAPCTALFGQTKDQRIPVAFFSDFYCPNCRVLEAVLEKYQKANPDTLRMVRYELPLLGAASTTASKAVLAADRQGAYAAMHDRLLRNRMVSDQNLVRAIAESIGLDGPQLVADMQRPEIETALEQARAIAEVFGFYGTPGMVIGRTVVLGAIPAAEVTRIITDEQSLPRLPCQQI